MIQPDVVVALGGLLLFYVLAGLAGAGIAAYLIAAPAEVLEGDPYAKPRACNICMSGWGTLIATASLAPPLVAVVALKALPSAVFAFVLVLATAAGAVASGAVLAQLGRVARTGVYRVGMADWALVLAIAPAWALAAVALRAIRPHEPAPPVSTAADLAALELES